MLAPSSPLLCLAAVAALPPFCVLGQGASPPESHGTLPPALVRLESLPGNQPAAPPEPPPQVDWTITARGEHQQTWSATVTKRDAKTGRETTTRREIIEVGTGLNYRDEAGRWQATRDEFQVTPEGFAVARSGPHQLIVGNNINAPDAIDFITSDGVRLRSGPLAVAWFDPDTGRNVILGVIRDTAGAVTAPNEVTFKSAFDGIDASIRITYRKAGMSSDLIFHEAPPEPEALGLSPRSRLELYTEFLPGTPAPAQTARTLRRELDALLRQRMVEPDFTDHQVDFGAYKMGTGLVLTHG